MKTKEKQTDFKVGDMVRCVDVGESELKKGKIYEIEYVDPTSVLLKGNDFYYRKDGFELVSTIEKEPVYGDTVWVRYNSEDIRWSKATFIAIINKRCAALHNDDKLYMFEKGNFCYVALYDEYRTTDPALDKKTIKLTLKEIAEKYGADEVIINE